MKKANEDLRAAFAAANPDEAKLKELVRALTTGQDNLFASYKNERDEELALMTPAEQGGVSCSCLGQWRQKKMDQRHQKAAGKRMDPK